MTLMTRQCCLWLAVLAGVVASLFQSLIQVAVCTICQLGCKQPLCEGRARKRTKSTLVLHFTEAQDI